MGCSPSAGLRNIVPLAFGFIAVAGLGGCALLPAPIAAPGHPAHPESTAGTVPPPPDVLDTARADRRDPDALPSTLLHPDMPEDMRHGDHHGGH